MMPRAVIPTRLWTSMRKEYLFEAFKCYETAITDQQSILLVADGIWCTLEEAHNAWRKQDGFKEMINSEECANSLNAAARLELAGPAVFNAWAKRFLGWFNDLDLPLDKTFETTGFERQMIQMEELDFGQPPLMNNIFVVNRRRFVEESMLSGKGALLEYMLEQYSSEDANFLFRQTRQIILANGDGAPIDW